ncbi:MAG: serine/threonine-protein kinase [Actinomycetota bacterium]|nr:serine/threonine-protein kinase [Actinomycetota bacterium]
MFGDDADIWVGRQYGPYSITELLGRGTVAHVYRATVREGREVALKVLTPFAEARGEIRGLFEQEFELMARVEHPNVLKVTQAGVIASTHYIEIEPIEGETVWDRVQSQRTIDLSHAIAIIQQMCSALDHVHDHRIVHRDVKPSNIMLDDKHDRAVLFDFGLAHDLDGPPPPEGRVFGSPMFLAPEQAVGGSVDGRTDLYSLGATLYRLVVGAAPFYGERNELLHAHVRLPPPDPRDAGVSDDLAEIVLRSMSKDPEQRFQSGADFAGALATIETPTPVGRKRGLLRRIAGRS